MNAHSLKLVLTELRSTTSRNEKEAILKELTGELEEAFKSLAYHAYHPRLNYFYKNTDLEQIEAIEPDELPELTLESAIKFLVTQVSSRKVTGHDALGQIKYILESLTEDEAELFSLVLDKELKCGASASTINKIWPNLIPIHPYMRCSGFSEKVLKNLTFPCYSQPKMDGLYVDIVVDDNSKVTVYTRSGQDVTHYLCPNLKYRLEATTSSIVFQGEVLVLKDKETGEYLDRKTGNGYLNGFEIDTDYIVFVVWDCIEYEVWSVAGGVDKTPYSERLNNLTEVIENLGYSSLKLIDTVVCTSSKDIIDHFKSVREQGEEGTVIKSLTGVWKSGTSKDQIKCKVVFDCELKVVDLKEGKGKYEGSLGALLCQSIDGMIEVSVGSGFTDAQRQQFFDNPELILNRIVTVRANDVVNDVNDDREIYSLFLPRFVEIRNDKDQADSLAEIQLQVKSFTNLLEVIK